MSPATDLNFYSVLLQPRCPAAGIPNCACDTLALCFVKTLLTRLNGFHDNDVQGLR